MSSKTEKAVFAAVNRILRKDGEVLCRCPYRSRSFVVEGRYYSKSLYDGTHGVYRDIDLESLARYLGVLKANEVIAAC